MHSCIPDNLDYVAIIMLYPYKKLGIGLLLSFVTCIAQAGFKDGVSAYEQGNYKAAIKEFVALAQKGDAKALFNIGLMVELGHGVPANPKLALKWYQRAYERKNKNAPFNMALIYYNGTAGKQDFTLALEWYKKAAALGNAAALINIGQMYFFGKGVKKSKIKAYVWYTLAGHRGLRKGLRNRDIVARKLTPFNISNAEHEYRILRVKYLDPFLK